MRNGLMFFTVVLLLFGCQIDREVISRGQVEREFKEADLSEIVIAENPYLLSCFRGDKTYLKVDLIRMCDAIFEVTLSRYPLEMTKREARRVKNDFVLSVVVFFYGDHKDSFSLAGLTFKEKVYYRS